MSQTSEIKLLKRFDQNVEITGNLTIGGSVSGISGDNFYLDGITKSGNTLTFSVNGATNQTYTFGSAAFANTTAFLQPDTDIDTGRITLANNVSTGGFGSFDDYQLLLYKTGTSASESYGIGIESNTMMFNSDSNYRFYVDNSLKVTISNSGNLTLTGTISASGYNKSNWDTAYGWGDHAGLYASSSHTHSSITNGTDNIAVGSATWSKNNGEANVAGQVYDGGTGDSRFMFHSGNGKVNVYTDGEYYANEGNNLVIHTGNIGSQSVSYATNAGTLDGIDSGSFLRSDASDSYSHEITASGTGWYLWQLGARGASSGAYGIGNRSNDAYRQLSFHVPNQAAYSSSGTIPSFGWYSNGAVQLMKLDSDSGNLWIKGQTGTNTPDGFRIDSSSYARIELDSNNNWSYVRLMDNGVTTWDIACYDSGNLEWRPGGSQTNRMTLDNGGRLKSNEFWAQTSTNSSRFTGAGDWGVRHYTSDGYIQFGPANSGHAHIYTDRSNFYMNKTLYISGGSEMNQNDIRAYIYYDKDNTGYYVNPASSSNLQKVTIVGTANGNDPTLKITSTTSNTFNHAIEAFNSNLTSGEHNIVLFGQQGNTKNSGYIGYYWSAAGSNNNFVTIGHWGADDLFRVYPDQITGNSSFRAPIFYDSNNTGYYIDGDNTSRLNILNVNAVGTSVGGVGKVMFPYGAEYSGSGTVTGAFKITLPQSWTNTMMTLKVTIYDYSVNESFEVHCGGYNYAGGGGYWVNTHAKIIANGEEDRNFNVRFGHDGSNCCILIGETNSSWSYPKVVVTEWVGGHSNETFSKWDNGWDISTVTTLPSNIDQTRSNNQIGRYQSIVYDSDNTGYYLNPASSSYLNTVSLGAQTWRGTITWNNTVNINISGESSFDMYSGGQFGVWNSNSSTWSIRAPWEGQVEIGQAGTRGLKVFGTMTATADVVAYSDIRTKENVKTIDNALEKVTNLRGVEYNRIGEADKKIGVIAQEIEKILPEVVTEDKDGMKAVSYGNIVGVLIEAVKEQQKQIDELKKLINP